MESGDLRIFEAVARLGSITGAAAELHTVQSNVTARIRHLEEELGVPVFRRHSRGVSLTPAGERLLPHAVKIAQVMAEAVRAVHDGDCPRGPLRLGALETITALRLPPILAKYMQRYPEVNLSLRTGTTRQLIEGVRGYKIEAALVAGPAGHPDAVRPHRTCWPLPPPHDPACGIAGTPARWSLRSCFASRRGTLPHAGSARLRVAASGRDAGVERRTGSGGASGNYFAAGGAGFRRGSQDRCLPPGLFLSRALGMDALRAMLLSARLKPCP